MLKIRFNRFGSGEWLLTACLLVLVCLKINAGGISSDLIVELSTDRVCYAPGQEVSFTVTGNVPANTFIRYRHGSAVVEEHRFSEKVSDNRWSWMPPRDDFKGYMVDLYYLDGSKEVVVGTIAVDVSSDWTRFPRYGFVADFEEYGDSEQKTANIYNEMAYLNRCHINGVQFQDWQWKHHNPVCLNKDGSLAGWYQDISNRYVGTDHIKKYIEVQHSYGMKSIFYNLCFGAWKDAEADGVKEEWGLYAKNSDGSMFQDFHGLPDSWQSNIYLENPADAGWQAYICDRNDEVYRNFDFDGYQIDQLGGRGYRSSDGKVYDYYGKEIDLPSGYASFINAVKARHGDKRLIMNAVSGYGAENILGTGKMDFCYNEVWGNGNGYGGVSEDQFANLYEIIKANDRFSGHSLRTVFAAYMNYDKADNGGSGDKLMNTPGVLLADAVMFALGGSHLELGDHMLSREYFPAAPLAMSDELKTAMIRYYDFMTGYQNLLRDNSSKYAFSANVSTTAPEVAICAWPPKENSVVTFSKNVGTAQVVHFLNFQDTEDLSWRDVNGTRNEPPLTQELPVSVETSRKISKVWAATPDAHAGAVQELSFTQYDGKVEFTLPSLKYWTMVVLESETVEDKILVVGDAAQNGWDTDNAISMQPYEGGSVFKATVYLEADKQFKFINGTDYGTCLHYNAEYEDYNFNEQYNINTANLVVNSNADYVNGSYDYKFTVAETGYYNITIDLGKMRIQVDNVALVVIGGSGYATYCYDKALDFSGMDDIKAYIATGTAGTGDVLKLIVQNVTDVPAFTGLLLHGQPGEYAIPRGKGSSTYLNMFIGVTSDVYIQEEDDKGVNFLLADKSRGVGFYRVDGGGTLPANKSYLSLPKTSVMSAKAVAIDFNDDITAVDGIVADTADDETYYTLTGMRVSRPLKGIYLHKGKKVVIK